MAITYRCDLAKSGSGGGSLKDFYRNKVLGDTTGLTSGTISPFSTRSTVTEGGVVIDATLKSVWLYVDFTLAETKGNDYWAALQIDITGFTSNYLPKTTSSTRQAITLFTDETSDKPTNSFFSYVSSSNTICIRKGDAFVEGDHYIIYGSWQY